MDRDSNKPLCGLFKRVFWTSAMDHSLSHHQCSRQLTALIDRQASKSTQKVDPKAIEVYSICCQIQMPHPQRQPACCSRCLGVSVYMGIQLASIQSSEHVCHVVGLVKWSKVDNKKRVQPKRLCRSNREGRSIDTAPSPLHLRGL